MRNGPEQGQSLQYSVFEISYAENKQTNMALTHYVVTVVFQFHYCFHWWQHIFLIKLQNILAPIAHYKLMRALRETGESLGKSGLTSSFRFFWSLEPPMYPAVLPLLFHEQRLLIALHAVSTTLQMLCSVFVFIFYIWGDSYTWRCERVL